jgi:hypothetical protein
MERPVGVTAIGTYYLLVGAYGCAFAALRIVTSGSFDLPVGAPLWNELEFYGERYALVFGILWCVIGWGLFRLRRWARWTGMLGMVPAIFLLVAPISMAKIGVRLLWYGLLIALHAGAGFYLAQAPTALEAFEKK